MHDQHLDATAVVVTPNWTYDDATGGADHVGPQLVVGRSFGGVVWSEV